MKIAGVDLEDFPEFSDAYIEQAQWCDSGEPLTEEELEDLREDYEARVWVCTNAYESLL